MNNKPRPGSLACDACRHKHLKCDGASPICGRCALEAQPCSYTASRRGQNRRGKRGSQRLSRPCPAAVRTPLPSAASPASALTATANAHDAATAAPLSSSTSSANATLAPYMNQRSLPPSSNPPPPPAWSLGESEAGRLRSLFYANFFAAHPFLVPKSFYAAQCYPHYLDLVVCFAGLHYVTPMPEATGLRDAIASKMSEVDEQTPCRVQALILYAILLHSRQEPQEAASCIARAANVAIHLGMHDPNFARTNSAGSPVREESFRRTWWELYTIDIYCAAIHRRPNFETFRAHSLPLLPCTQAQYEAGECDPCPPTIQAFEDSVFIPDNRSRFSSYCFRIDAIRIVSRVLALATKDDAQPDDIQALDNALASWDYNLPSWCVDVVTPSGEVDLMLFQARCFILCAGIFLHFPRSELPDKVPSADDIACSRGYTQLAATSRHHAIKAIAASKEMSNLATVPWPLEKHSPFFVCGLVLGCIIQLATGSVHVHRCGLNCLQQHKDRVMLMLGALRRLGERWKLAQHAMRCLKDVAQNIFTIEGVSHISSPEAPSFRDSAVDSGESVFTNYDWFDLFSADNLPGDLLGSLR